MKLSTKGRYGLRLLVELARHYGGGPVTLKDVARSQEISEKYLWHLIPQLKSAGLISAARGSRGGYKLARHPGTITLLEIVSCLEGSVCLSECCENSSVCKRSAACACRDVWAEISAKILEHLAQYDLEKIAARQNDKQERLSYAI